MTDNKFKQAEKRRAIENECPPIPPNCKRFVGGFFLRARIPKWRPHGLKGKDREDCANAAIAAWWGKLRNAYRLHSLECGKDHPCKDAIKGFCQTFEDIEAIMEQWGAWQDGEMCAMSSEKDSPPIGNYYGGSTHPTVPPWDGPFFVEWDCSYWFTSVNGNIYPIDNIQEPLEGTHTVAIECAHAAALGWTELIDADIPQATKDPAAWNDHCRKCINDWYGWRDKQYAI